MGCNIEMGLETRREHNFFDEYLGRGWGKRYRGVEDKRRELREI